MAVSVSLHLARPQAAACEVAGLTECSKSTDFAADFAACRPAAEARRTVAAAFFVLRMVLVSDDREDAS